MALEWLKTILGDKYTPEIDTAVSQEIGKGFVSRTAGRGLPLWRSWSTRSAVAPSGGVYAVSSSSGAYIRRTPGSSPPKHPPNLAVYSAAASYHFGARTRKRSMSARRVWKSNNPPVD